MYRSTKVLNPGKGYPCVFRNWRAKHSHCSKLHGYDLIFEVTLEAHALDEHEWVFDFGKYEILKDEIKNTFDHTCLIAEDDPDKDHLLTFAKHEILDPIVLPKVSCEAFACWLAVRATDMLSYYDELERVRVYSARVYEHEANSATYFPELIK